MSQWPIPSRLIVPNHQKPARRHGRVVAYTRVFLIPYGRTPTNRSRVRSAVCDLYPDRTKAFQCPAKRILLFEERDFDAQLGEVDPIGDRASNHCQRVSCLAAIYRLHRDARPIEEPGANLFLKRFQEFQKSDRALRWHGLQDGSQQGSIQ